MPPNGASTKDCVWLDCVCLPCVVVAAASYAKPAMLVHGTVMDSTQEFYEKNAEQNSGNEKAVA